MLNPDNNWHVESIVDYGAHPIDYANDTPKGFGKVVGVERTSKKLAQLYSDPVPVKSIMLNPDNNWHVESIIDYGAHPQDYANDTPKGYGKAAGVTRFKKSAALLG